MYKHTFSGGVRPVQNDAVRPYRNFAAYYDDLIGRRMLPLWIRNFNRLVGRYNITFGNAADIACGTGGFAHFVARHWGVPVVGIDVSPEMIAVARKRNLHCGVSFLVQDMRRLSLPAPVDLITCNFDSLNYLISVTDIKRAFNCFYKNLTGNGYLIFDMIIVNHVNWMPESESFSLRFRDVLSIWNIQYDDHRNLRLVEISHYEKSTTGVRHIGRELHIQRAYPVSVIMSALMDSGFSIAGLHDSYSLMYINDYSTRATFIAHKTDSRLPAYGCNHANKK